MAKVKYPLFSGDVSGAFGKKMIFKKGGIVTRMFWPRNPRSAAQQRQRELFKEFSVPSLTQEQADLLYSAILHQHDDLYSSLGHGHDHGGLSGLADDDHTQYYNQTRGDARYSRINHAHLSRFILSFGTYANNSPMTGVSNPFGVTIDRVMTLVSWAQHCYVATVNNITNYWRFELRRISDNAVINTITTAGISAGVQSQLFDTTFSNNPLSGANLGIYINCSPVGAPGALYMFCPVVEAEI